MKRTGHRAALANLLDRRRRPAPKPAVGSGAWPTRCAACGRPVPLHRCGPGDPHPASHYWRASRDEVYCSAEHSLAAVASRTAVDRRGG